MELQNTDAETRIWPNLQTTDGTTLELGPGEVGDVAVDEAPDDPFLRPVQATLRAKRGKAPTGAGKAASGADDAPDTPSEPDAPKTPDTSSEPAEADASGKEA